MPIDSKAISKLMQAISAFNKSADKLSIAYERLINKSLINENHASSEFLTKILQGYNDGVIVIDNEGRVILFNSVAVDLLGIPAEDVLGKPFCDIFALREDAKNNKAGENNAINTKENTTEQYNTKMLEVLSDIILNIVHLMRSPLSAIQIFAELLKQDLDNDKQSMADDILASVYSLDAVLCNLLFYAQPINLCIQQIDIIEILEESLSFAMPAINHHGISLNKQYIHNRLNCAGDAEQLKQVFLNIILNAIQAMPNGGILHVSADYVFDYINIEMSDNGCGIPEEFMERIFTPFWTTKKSSGGTGLGLSVVYKIIQAHHGRIHIRSNYGKGTTVSIKLPVENK